MRNSSLVQEEAASGLAKGSLVPIVLDKETIPKKFSEHQAVDLSSWKGETDLTEIHSLFRRLAGLVPPSRIDTVRPGFDPQFLDGYEIPLPGVTGSAAVLRYNHFTVVMNPARRLAHYAAYNVNGTQTVQIERRRDNWERDPLLPHSFQMELSLLSRSPYDRGRLAARSKVSWGKERQASLSVRQASYWPNVAPKHAKFNRIWWLRLENWERDVARAFGRATGFVGPVFSEDDEPFRGELELEDGLVAIDTFRVPREYWKIVVVVASDGTLQLAAHLMNQYEMVKEKVGRNFDLADYCVSLATIEQRARVRFAATIQSAGGLTF